MAVGTVATRYAKSLIDLAQEKGIVQELSGDMQFFQKTLAENRQLGVLLKNPIVRNAKKWSIINAVFGSRLNPMTLSFFQIVAQKGRDNILEDIAVAFNQQVDVMKGVERATVITTTPLTDELRTQLKAKVQSLTNAKLVELEEKIDPKLIGGYVLRVGDQQVDASIKNQLNELRLKFLN
ncbi:ATP synthase F1 subunit delta [Fibrella sp. WM1]|uniref:ATP synthase F1 subunit delta n=1 Tax=Fibrella musci TaxID=3242485 RepID=UPI00351FF956